MNTYIQENEWNIVEDNFSMDNHPSSESLFSIGNGLMGQRANFEEKYSGKSLQGSYIAGIYYPDKTRVGWWKNGYPEYFAKVLNAPNWTGINVNINGEELDLAKCEVKDFQRVLNMQHAYIERNFTAILSDNKEIRVSAKRFLSIIDTELAVIKYSVTPVNFDAEISFTPYIDGDVRNEDSNYDEQFWANIVAKASNNEAFLQAETLKTKFNVGMSMRYEIELNGKKQDISSDKALVSEKCTGYKSTIKCVKGEEATIYKYVAVLSSLNHNNEDLAKNAKTISNKAIEKGYADLLSEHTSNWEAEWEHSDIKIEGDIKSQQAIRFNILQLKQTYTGEDDRLNIGPKGFTGEKYGGSTYWDTEAYCVPFCLSTAKPEVSRNLLIYRYKQLDRAIENATKLGFKNGAALYPMVTMNGEECHNEWEITFEEIHRNGAIAYAIYNYINYTADKKYLAEYGLEVLIGIARFWKQRANYSQAKEKYVILGVTGPNEYENNVNNNWYTNTMAAWCMKYANEAMAYVKETDNTRFNEIINKTTFDYEVETKEWKEVSENMYFPYSEKHNVFLQQDNYLDKEQLMADMLSPCERPINQNWSWDRILRSCFIKQADVLQGLYFFQDDYDMETIKNNFKFYEARTVHESSLSPCVHSILAASIGDIDKAYELYLRTSRLDIDDYNNEVHEGLHITSMAGTWMSIVEGFAGMRIKNDQIHLKPLIPTEWKSYSFNTIFRGNTLNVKIIGEQTVVTNVHGANISIIINAKEYLLEEAKTLTV